MGYLCDYEHDVSDLEMKLDVLSRMNGLTSDPLVFAGDEYPNMGYGRTASGSISTGSGGVFQYPVGDTYWASLVEFIIHNCMKSNDMESV